MDINLQILSKSQAAKMLGIGKEKLGRLLSSGRIGFIQIDNRIHIPYTEILNFIQTNTVRITEESLKQTLKHHNSKQRVQKKSSEQFNSISLFNTLLEAKTSGKYLQ